MKHTQNVKALDGFMGVWNERIALIYKYSSGAATDICFWHQLPCVLPFCCCMKHKFTLYLILCFFSFGINNCVFLSVFSSVILSAFYYVWRKVMFVL